MSKNKPPYSIEVDVETAFLEEQSQPEDDRYVFSYTITIHNSGSLPAQLLTRRWVITNGNGKVEEIRGEGVVGEQPHLSPGESFRYTSGVILETPVGTMEGSYQMVADDTQEFEAAIPIFTLSIPNGLH